MGNGIKYAPWNNKIAKHGILTLLQQAMRYRTVCTTNRLVSTLSASSHMAFGPNINRSSQNKHNQTQISPLRPAIAIGCDRISPIPDKVETSNQCFKIRGWCGEPRSSAARSRPTIHSNAAQGYKIVGPAPLSAEPYAAACLYRQKKCGST